MVEEYEEEEPIIMTKYEEEAMRKTLKALIVEQIESLDLLRALLYTVNENLEKLIKKMEGSK